MSEHTAHLGALPVDELWLLDWVDEGVAALERYLGKHAAFAAFLASRDGLDSIDGDGAAQR